MYVIERSGKLYGPYETYQAAASAGGICYQGSHNNMMGGPVSDIREVHPPGGTQQSQGFGQSDSGIQDRIAYEQARSGAPPVCQSCEGSGLDELIRDGRTPCPDCGASAK